MGSEYDPWAMLHDTDMNLHIPRNDDCGIANRRYFIPCRNT